jgi:hypothetical protein
MDHQICATDLCLTPPPPPPPPPHPLTAAGVTSREIAAAGGKEVNYPKLALALMAMQRNLVDLALAIIARNTPAAAQPTSEECGLVRDACMALTLFANISLAQRQHVLITAKASQHAAAPCTREDCVGSALLSGSSSKPGCTCYGNRFERRLTPPEVLASWQLVVAHSKGQSGVVLPIWDPQFRRLLEYYEFTCRPILMSGGDETVAAMFVDNTGLAFSEASIGPWWTKLLK